MPNSRLVDKVYPVPEHLKKFLGGSISYHNLKMTKSRMTSGKEKDINDFNAKGGDNVLKWVELTLKTDRDAIHNVKQTGMNAGRENEFIKPHEKDRDNANPTAVGGLPKINKGSVSRKIIDDKEVYNESIKEEIKKIKYLIEYINKNKKTI